MCINTQKCIFRKVKKLTHKHTYLLLKKHSKSRVFFVIIGLIAAEVKSNAHISPDEITCRYTRLQNSIKRISLGVTSTKLNVI